MISERLDELYDMKYTCLSLISHWRLPNLINRFNINLNIWPTANRLKIYYNLRAMNLKWLCSLFTTGKTRRNLSYDANYSAWWLTFQPGVMPWLAPPSTNPLSLLRFLVKLSLGVVLPELLGYTIPECPVPISKLAVLTLDELEALSRCCCWLLTITVSAWLMLPIEWLWSLGDLQ